MGYTSENNKRDVNRFKLLLEYDFYVGDKEDSNPLDDELITEEPPEEDMGDAEPTEPDMGGEADMGEEPDADLDLGDEPDMGEEPDADLDMGDEPDMGGEPDMGPLPEPEPMEDEVELDVTELVQGTQEAKNSADEANERMAQLMGKFDNLTQSLDKMAQISSKIDDLENEFEKRNPTDKEKLEMRSLNSYPYNLKLTDYWSEKEGNYDVMGGKKEDEEYVLTQDEVDNDYNQIEIKDSFDLSNEKDNFK